MCESSSKTRYKLFSHIRNEHDPEFPYTEKTNIPFIVRTSSGKQIDFTCRYIIVKLYIYICIQKINTSRYYVFHGS